MDGSFTIVTLHCSLSGHDEMDMRAVFQLFTLEVYSRKY